MKKLLFLLSAIIMMTLNFQTASAQTKKSHGATGALIGAAAGAGVGAAVSHDKSKGAIIGGVVGAGTGYAIGHKKKYHRKRVYRKS
ncbi:MAG: YMGG-like glycine zipper-containing protein [Ginsengibacter sp.]